MIITLVPQYLAKEGSEFFFIGPLKECGTCNLKNVCYNLKPNKKYKVVKSREKEHKCFIHPNNKVITVEVEEMHRQVMVPRKYAKEGAIISYKRVECDNIKCPFSSICIFNSVPEDAKLKILTVKSGKCPLNFGLVEAEVE